MASCYECVFLVDDDEDDHFLVRQIFARLSPECRIKSLMNGEQLLKTLAKTSNLPSLILLDLNMPLLSGLEALKIIRQQSRYDSVPILIWTTSSQETDRQKVIALKANGFFTKPVTLQEYSQMVLKLRSEWLLGRWV